TQGGKLVNVVFGTRVEGLRHDHSAHNEAQDGPTNQSHTRARGEKPVVQTAVAKLGLGQHFAVGQLVAQDAAHGCGIGAWLQLNQHVGDHVGGHVEQTARAVGGGEDVGRHGERADAVGEA